MNDTCICENTPTVWRLTGVTRTLRLRIFNPDGTPLDLTGRTVAVTIARDNSEFSYAPGFVIEGDDGNVVKFEWPADKQGAGDYTINVTTTDGSGNVDRVNWHGPTGIRLVDFSFMVRGEDALGVTSEANIGLDGTFTMNGTGMSAYDEWLAEGHTGTPEDFIAWLRRPAVDAATEAAATVDAKMAEVDADMATIEATAAADHTRAGSDHTTATGDHIRAESDHAQAVADSQRAATDHQQATSDAAAAASDREKAATDRTKAANDRQQAAVDHGLAATDHATAVTDHTRAQSDHSTASADHTKAAQDSEQAASDHTRAGGDHDTAVADHQQAEADHTRAEADHTTAAADHTTAASDHTQATADHAVMAGYDTRLGNVESEVSQLGQKVDDIEKGVTGADEDEEIYVVDNDQNKIASITPAACNFKNLKTNGKDVVPVDGFKTINGESIVGSGDITISGVDGFPIDKDEIHEASEELSIESNDGSEKIVGVTIDGVWVKRLRFLVGKKIRVFGGSVAWAMDSRYDVGDAIRAAGAELVDDAESGAGYANNISISGGDIVYDGVNIQKQVDDATVEGQAKSDIYILWSSTNDLMTNAVQVGTEEDYTVADNYDTSKRLTQDGAINYCIKKLCEFAPEAKVVIIGSLKCFENPGGGWTEFGCGLNGRLYSLVDGQKKCAARASLPFFSLWENSGFNEYNNDLYFTNESTGINDGTHPNRDGYVVIVDKILNFLKTI